MANNANFKATVEKVSREMTTKEKIQIKDTSSAIKIDDATKEGNLDIELDAYAVLSIHNEKSDNKDYYNYVFLATDGEKYVTGSESLYRAFTDIVDELTDAGEEVSGQTFRVYRKPSKNYTGKDFLTCTLL